MSCDANRPRWKKLACAATENDKKLEISDIGIRGIVLSV